MLWKELELIGMIRNTLKYRKEILQPMSSCRKFWR